MKPNFIWINGEFVPCEDADVDVFAPTRQTSHLIFEDIRCFDTPDGPAVFRLGDHLEQFLESIRARGYDVQYDIDDLCDTVYRTLTFNGVREGSIRPAMYLNDGHNDVPKLAVATWAWPANTERENREWGFKKAVSLNSGKIPERAALFLVDEQKIYTPPSEIFGNQVIRDSVITLATDLGIPVFVQPLSREWLYRADEVFLSTVVAEVTPVREVDGRAIGADCPGPVTHALQSAFFETTRGRGRRSSEWLEWVWGSFVGM
ncbi:MAG: branched-chain amino acid transaminase [Anaerolineales bacterium]